MGGSNYQSWERSTLRTIEAMSTESPKKTMLLRPSTTACFIASNKALASPHKRILMRKFICPSNEILSIWIMACSCANWESDKINFEQFLGGGSSQFAKYFTHKWLEFWWTCQPNFEIIALLMSNILLNLSPPTNIGEQIVSPARGVKVLFLSFLNPTINSSALHPESHRKILEE